jgi:hypothetical protein
MMQAASEFLQQENLPERSLADIEKSLADIERTILSGGFLKSTARADSPRYKVGDRVREVSGIGCGTVTFIYVFDNQHRYVVKSDDGSEFVCFERELAQFGSQE